MQHAHALRAPSLCALALIAISMTTTPLAHAAAPKISGTPVTSIIVGQAWSFQPTASDADGNKLTFSIANKPGFASFSPTTGRVWGAPLAEHARTWSGIVISVSDGTSTVSLPAFSLVVKPNPNKSPTITGTPATTATVGVAYSFQPTAKDPEGKTLTFQILGKPSWCTFNSSTGRLSGTPSAAGTYGGIFIMVSDGVSAAGLPHFSITVAPSGSATNTPPTSRSSVTTGAATLSWTPPTRNTDGSTLTNLAGYRIGYGQSASSLSTSITISNPGLSNYVIDNLPAGTWYFGIKAYTSSGSESVLSSVVSKTIH